MKDKEKLNVEEICINELQKRINCGDLETENIVHDLKNSKNK